MEKYYNPENICQHSGAQLKAKETVQKWEEYFFKEIKKINERLARIEKHLTEEDTIKSFVKSKPSSISEHTQKLIDKHLSNYQEYFKNHCEHSGTPLQPKEKTSNLSFSEALEWMKKGKKVKREGWEDYECINQLKLEINGELLKWYDLVTTDWLAMNIGELPEKKDS